MTEASSCWPTPDEWVADFLALDREKQLQVAEACIRNAQAAQTCFLMDHATLQEEHNQRIRAQLDALRERR